MCDDWVYAPDYHQLNQNCAEAIEKPFKENILLHLTNVKQNMWGFLMS